MDADAVTESLPLHLGRVEGRLGALETRVDRHEQFVGEKLGTIEEKLDRVLASQAQSAVLTRMGRGLAVIAASASGWVALFWTHHG